jgi:transcriptional regulator with XRE-family HTH domain
VIKRTDDLSMPGDRKAFRDRLVTLMKEKKITAAELARGAKVSKDAISTYTTMRSLPTPKTLARLAQVLECKPHDLLPDKPLNESLLEMREHAKPGFKVLVVKMTLPVDEALHYYGALAKLEQKMERKLAATPEKPAE